MQKQPSTMVKQEPPPLYILEVRDTSLSVETTYADGGSSQFSSPIKQHTHKKLHYLG
jgi:hypothetical protein